MLIGVRQRGLPRPWLCTSLAHDSHKRWWPHGTSAMRVSRGATRHLAEVNSCVSWYGRWRTGVVTGVIIIMMLCIVKPWVATLLWCAYLSSKFNRPTRLRVAFGNKCTWKPRQSYFVWYFRVSWYFVWYLRLFSSDCFPYFVAPAFSTPAVCSHSFHSCIFHSRIFSAPAARSNSHGVMGGQVHFRAKLE